MANRKINRNINVGNPRNYSDLYRQSRDGATAVSTSTQTETSNESSTPAVSKRNVIDWQHEYGYVMDDLRRLTFITAALILAMIAAGFVL